MRESDIQNLILLALSQAGCTVWRNNTGVGWQGKVSRVGQSVVITEPRPLHAGLCVGSSDIIGIAPDGRFLAIEVKTQTGRATDDQIRFIEAVRRKGGISGVCRSVEDALDLLPSPTAD